MHCFKYLRFKGTLTPSIVKKSKLKANTIFELGKKISSTHLIHQFMVKVGHLQFSKAPGCLINVTRAEVLLEQENYLFDQVLDRAQAPADPPNIVQSD